MTVSRITLLAACFLFLTCNLSPAFAQQPGDALLVPGLVLGLRHNVNQQVETQSNYTVLFSAPAGAAVRHVEGGDLGAPLHRGYEWWMVRDEPRGNPAVWKLPPGVVLGLKHSANQARENITVFGHNPCSGPQALPGFRRYVGGDLGAPSGQGYCWYESTGEDFSNWGVLERLPRWAVVGLKHSRNQPDKKLRWMGKTYDPADRSIAPPPGFARRSGGDLGAPAGHGYFWYEKTTGPEIVVKPQLRHRLARSLLITQGDNLVLDRDRDYLVDSLENELAGVFRPCFVFDSDENARRPHEPVTLFRVYPLDIANPAAPRILIKWLFLFRVDGGYGPNASSVCKDAHEGDNDDALYELGSQDGGITWTLLRASLSFKGLEWPTNSRLEVYDITHPVIYLSAGKHHEYFNRDYDHNDSRYTEWGCNDDVNGQGARILADLQSVDGTATNNVGEFHSHPAPVFVNDLSRYFPGHQAWGTGKFYEVDPLLCKWLPTCQTSGSTQKGNPAGTPRKTQQR